MTIDVVFDPPLPSDPPETFNSKAFATLGALNTWAGEANALASSVNADVTDPGVVAIGADLIGPDTIGTVAGIASQTSQVAAIAASVTTVAGISADVTAVANNEANINAAVADLPSLAAKVSRTGDTMTGNLTVPSLNGGQLAGHRNNIINGAFSVNQRGYVSGAATTAGNYTLDRWKVTGTDGVTFSTTANKTTVTIPSGQTLQQVIEGLNLQSGTYVLSWEGTAQGRINGGSYGASGAVTASLTGGTNATIEFNAGTVTSIQFELGTVATPFEYRLNELQLCQRYYCETRGSVTFRAAAEGNSSACSIFWPVEMRDTPATTNNGGVITNASTAIVDGATKYGARYAINSAAAGASSVANRIITASAEL